MSALLKAPARPVLVVSSSAVLKAEPTANLVKHSLACFSADDGPVKTGTVAKFVPASSASGDDETVWVPDDIGGSAPGRWLVYAAENQPSTLVLRKADGTIDGAGGGADFTQPVLHVNTGGAVPSTGLYGLSVDFTVGANRRGLFWDAANATWTAAQDTLGDDTTISSYLPLRVAALKATSVANAAGGMAATGFVRMAAADEIRARIGGGEYRLAAALAGPIAALGDSTIATATLDASALLQLTSRTGNIALRAATTVDFTDEAGSNEAFQVDPAAGKVYVKGTIDTLSAGPLTFGGSAATSISVSGLRVTNAADPASAQDLATKAYVDAYLQGLSVKASVRLASTANLTLSGTQTVDGVSISTGRVLAKNQTTAADRGIYDVSASGPWARSADYASGSSAAGTFCFVEEGTTNADSGWVCTSDSGSDVVGTDSLAFTQFSGAGQITAGAGLTKTGNTLDVVAANPTITVNADSIEVGSNSLTDTHVASGAAVSGLKISPSFGAQNIAQTGGTSITAGSLGVLTAIVDNSGGTLTIGGNTTGQTAGKASTTWAFLGALTVASTTAMADALTITKSGFGTTRTTGLKLANTNASGSQDSPDLEFEARQGGTVKRLRMGVRPSSGGMTFFADKDDGGGSYSEGSGFSHSTLDSSLFDERWRANGYVASVGSSGYQFTDGSGVTRGGSGDLQLSNLATSLPLLIHSAKSAGGTGSGVQIHLNAATQTAGYLLDLGDGVSYARRFGIAFNGRLDWSGTAAATALGTLGMNVTTGRAQLYVAGAARDAAVVQLDTQWNVRTVVFADSPVTAAIGDRFNVDTTGGVVVINLPAVPATSSTRSVDIRVKDSAANFAVNKCTLTPNGTDKIDGANASKDLTTTGGSTGLSHDGNSADWHLV